MNSDFDEFCGAIIDQVFCRMDRKGDEYNGKEADRLSQLRKQARLNTMLPSNVIKVLMSKHVTALMDTSRMISKEELNERGIDMIIYLMLWMWLLEEEEWKESTTTMQRLMSKSSTATSSNQEPILYSLNGWTGATRKTKLSSFRGHRSSEEEC